MTPAFTLLIVDDEKQNRTLLTELLKDDHHLILAKNGEQALQRARSHLPDLILLDVLMPEMDGYAVIRALKNDDLTRDIPVIFVTALDSAGDEEQGLELGAVDYISKPFHPSIVRARIRNHLQSVQQRRLLEQLAMLDSLTGIPNRRRFAQVFDQEWRRCQRDIAPLSLIVVDVDHFKDFNDTHGHAAGDQVLRQVAATLRATLRRPADFVARYGGEEFVILAEAPNLDGLRTVGERIRRAVSEIVLPTTQGPLTVTISLGGCIAAPTGELPDFESRLLGDADRNLYAAKADGRNRVVATPLSSPLPVSHMAAKPRSLLSRLCRRS